MANFYNNNFWTKSICEEIFDLPTLSKECLSVNVLFIFELLATFSDKISRFVGASQIYLRCCPDKGNWLSPEGFSEKAVMVDINSPIT